MEKVGIYFIENMVNGKKYIGLSANIEKRFMFHKRRLRSGKHRNKHLQSSFDKYGEESFKFYVVEECLEDELSDKEKYWIDKLDTCNRSFGYNKTFGGWLKKKVQTYLTP